MLTGDQAKPNKTPQVCRIEKTEPSGSNLGGHRRAAPFRKVFQ